MRSSETLSVYSESFRISDETVLMSPPRPLWMVDPLISSKKQSYKIVEENDEGESMLYFELESDKGLHVKERPLKSVWQGRKSGVLWCLNVLGNIGLASAMIALLYKPYLVENYEKVDEGIRQTCRMNQTNLNRRVYLPISLNR